MENNEIAKDTYENGCQLEINTLHDKIFSTQDIIGSVLDKQVEWIILPIYWLFTPDVKFSQQDIDK